MTKTPFQRFVVVFWIWVITDLLALLFGLHILHWIIKPLLMPVLMLALFSSRVEATGKYLLITGLFFSWLGDVFLLFESRNGLFFILGLASFFITHACYIYYFLSIPPLTPSLLKQQPYLILLVLFYGAALVWLIFPDLGALKVPVVLYATIICGMLLGSLHIYLRVKAPANSYFVAGVALFVVSDSLLAVNKFYLPLPLAGIWIMLSYCAAQYFILRGFVGRR